MLKYFRAGDPLPRNLFHPRWFLDGPDVVTTWNMGYSASQSTARDGAENASNLGRNLGLIAPPVPVATQHAHRYQDDGAQLILDAAATAIEKLNSLPPGRKETYAASFADMTSKLATRADEITSSRALLPAQPPDSHSARFSSIHCSSCSRARCLTRRLGALSRGWT
jgi:hypothetical protein